MNTLDEIYFDFFNVRKINFSLSEIDKADLANFLFDVFGKRSIQRSANEINIPFREGVDVGAMTRSRKPKNSSQTIKCVICFRFYSKFSINELKMPSSI